MELHALDTYFDLHQERFLEEWSQLLRFPSVSSDPARRTDCIACCHWLGEHLRALDFAVQELDTPGLPVLFAERPGAPGKPTVLFYGHYDVQPVDPLEAWTTPPFDPHWRDGRLYARGAEDNKGQHFYVLKAIEALVRSGVALPPLKIVLEGEEECGSRGFTACMADWKQRLRADVLMVTDISMQDAHTPAIILGLRGLVSLTVEVTGPSHDLHSGVHGGVAPNPAQELARIIGTLHGPNGRVAVRGFRAGCGNPLPRESELALRMRFDPEAYVAETGTVPAGGETALSPVERTAFRPSIDINGIHSGFGGPGVKTIIPSKAVAKLTARLVAGQNPEKCLEALIRHFKQELRTGFGLAFPEQGVGGAGFRLDPDSPWIRRGTEVLTGLYGYPPAFQWCGASIPVLAQLSRVAGATPLMVGFGLEADRIHAPDESFSLEQFRMGYRYAAAFLGGM